MYDTKNTNLEMCIEVGEHGSVREGIKEVGSGKKGLQDESVMVELRLEG